MDWSKRRAKYRTILSGSHCVYPGSVFDPISARIAEAVGYEICMFAGSTASLAVLGAPDLVVLTLSEFADQALRINRACGLPLMVDADHGYGNALNVMRTIEELETAGVAAATIEDTMLPLPYGAPDKTRLIPLDEGIGKLRAALAARQDPAFAVIARTSAMGMTGLAEAVERVKAYAATGVDAVFLAGVESREQIEAAAAVVKVPLVLGNVASDVADLDYLAGKGVRICLQGHAPFRAAVRAIHDAMTALRQGTPPDKIAGLASGELMKQVTRDRDYRRWMKEFLGSG
jgi:carboxyvinyl-carboxyphosphonate phosphorylmutase